MTPLDIPVDVLPESLGLHLPPLPPGGHGASDLVTLARSFQLAPEAWKLLAPHVMFDARQYRRVRLHRDAHWEALLLCWLPGQGTTLHDHGGSVGVSAVLWGDLREERYRTAGEGQPLVCVSDDVAGTGSVAVELTDTIHRMWNDSAVPAVSLHCYSPPLTVLGAHDARLGTRWEVPVADSPLVQVGGDPQLGDP